MSKSEAEQARAIADAQKQFKALWRMFKPLPLLAEALADVGDLQQARRTAAEALEVTRADTVAAKERNVITQTRSEALTKSLAAIEKGIAKDKAAADAEIAEAKGECVRECVSLKAQAEQDVLDAKTKAKVAQATAENKLAATKKDTAVAEEKLAQANAALDVAREKLG